jgi:flagellar secretion chaperone FliS
LSFHDPYLAYSEGAVYSGNPLGMVVALYEGVIECVQQAKSAFATGDIWERSKAVNKGVKLLTELLVSLDHKEGGEISANLTRLYSYIQCRLLDAHANKSIEPLAEAEQLRTTLLDGWREAAEKMESAARTRKSPSTLYMRAEQPEEAPSIGYGYFGETAEFAGVSATF